MGGSTRVVRCERDRGEDCECDRQDGDCRQEFLGGLDPPPWRSSYSFSSFIPPGSRPNYDVHVRYSRMAHACPVPSQADINPERGAIRHVYRASRTTRIPLRYPRLLLSNTRTAPPDTFHALLIEHSRRVYYYRCNAPAATEKRIPYNLRPTEPPATSLRFPKRPKISPFGFRHPDCSRRSGTASDR